MKAEAFKIIYETIDYYRSQGDVYVVRILEQLLREINNSYD